MHVFLTGATGYVGSSVLDRLIAAGHDVTALVRSPDKADLVKTKAANPVIGDLGDDQLVHELAAISDGVIHLASPGDETSAAVDNSAATSILRAIEGSGKPYLHTTGLWVHGSGAAITESTPMNAPEITAWRLPIADRVLNALDVRSVVIAPALVYGHGGGLLNLIAAAPHSGTHAPALTMIGTGTQHWATVHVDDLAELYVLALEKAPARSYFIAANGVNASVKQISEAVSQSIGLAGRVAAEPIVQTLGRLGMLGEALLLDQQASGDAARRVLGWTPAQPTILEEIARTTFAHKV